MAEYFYTKDCDNCLQPFYDDIDSDICHKCLDFT